MKKRNLIQALLLVGIVALFGWWYWSRSASCAAFRLNRAGAVVQYGVKGGYFLTVPEQIDLPTFLTQYESEIQTLASFDGPLDMTLEHTTSDVDDFESLMRLKGNIVLSFSEGFLDHNETQLLKEQGHLWYISTK